MEKQIGNTPIIYQDGLYYKLESYNPTGSIKARPAFNILKHYLEKGIIKKGDTIIEASSGNMGIALAYFGFILGLKVIIVMPDNVSIERKRLLKKYQARLVLVKGNMQRAIRVAKELEARGICKWTNQFNNVFNKEAHYKTGEEIFEVLPDVDYIVCGIGSAGTIRGIGEYIYKNNKKSLLIGVLPSEKQHLIQGIGAGFIPPLLNELLLDSIKYVTSQDVMKEFKEDNPLKIGLSSIACQIVGKNIKQNNVDKKILIIVADDITRYESLIKCDI